MRRTEKASAAAAAIQVVNRAIDQQQWGAEGFVNRAKQEAVPPDQTLCWWAAAQTRDLVY